MMTGDEETDGTTPSGAPQWVTMDGIVEGRIADYAALTKATAALNRLGICRFELGRDGGKFTLMPDNQRVSGKGLDEERQAELLQHLATLAQGASGPVESTLRCAMVFDEVCAETVFRAAVPPPAGPGIEPLTRVRPRRADDVPAEAPPRPPW
ncbi:MAG: hypothetical protein KDC98_22175, partial [Planctomycetes bacterium]|nr:hypothetical protein [Planctomycetota bacterium]